MRKLLIGIDENGLGPRLGPLLVTGVLARATDEGVRWLRSEGAGAMGLLDDSKKLASFHRPEVAEAWARALMPGISDADTLIERLSLMSKVELRSLCPAEAETQCWGASPSFHVVPRIEGEVARDLESLRQRGVEVLSVKSMILCSERLHRAREAGHSLLTTDLHAMERLLLAFREEAGEEVDAVCGKVGALDRYLPKLGPLAGIPAAIEVEGKAISRYRLAGLGTVAFIRDADGSDLLVALASLVGKYLREALMGKIATHYLQQDPSLPRPSGYRDPVTARFVEGTAPQRRLALVPDRCFERPLAGMGLSPRPPPHLRGEGEQRGQMLDFSRVTLPLSSPSPPPLLLLPLAHEDGEGAGGRGSDWRSASNVLKVGTSFRGEGVFWEKHHATGLHEFDPNSPQDRRTSDAGRVGRVH